MQELFSLYKNYWANILKFDGRTSRRRFWLTLLIVFVLGAVVFIIFNTKFLGVFGGMVRHIFWVVSIIPTLSLLWRRIQDTGRPGWWAVVPIVNLLFALGQSDQENSYGPVPTD